VLQCSFQAKVPVLEVPVLTGLPCCGRFRARFQVMSRLQGLGHGAWFLQFGFHRVLP